MNTIEKTVSNISEETSSQIIEPKPTDSLFNDEKAVDASIENPNEKVKKTLSEKIKEFRANKKAKKEAKEKAEKEMLEEYRKRYWASLDNKFYEIRKGSLGKFWGIVEKDNVQIYTMRKLVDKIIFNTIFTVLLLTAYAPKIAKASLNLLLPVNKGSVVSEMIGKDYSLYGIDLDEKPETIETVLYLDNKKDALMKDKIKVGSEIQIKSFPNNIFEMDKRLSKDVYKIDDLVIKQR